MQHDDNLQYCTVYLKGVMKIDLKISHKNVNMWGDRC